MFVYMGMVEQRINEILQAFAYIQAKNNADGEQPSQLESEEDKRLIQDIQKKQE